MKGKDSLLQLYRLKPLLEAKKIQEHYRNKQRRKEKAESTRNEHSSKEQQHQEEKHDAGDGGHGSGGGFFENFGDMFTNPEILKLMKDPELMKALLDVVKNPANIMKYKDNPKIVEMLEKIMALKGAPPNMPPKPIRHSN
uniref:STI1 domain-containing protein n=1 Tax=Syphacia muris TaxID=451379 RepID=A0A0N5A8B7_9BILA